MSSTREARASFAVFVLRAGSGGSDRMRTLRLLGSNKYKKKRVRLVSTNANNGGTRGCAYTNT